jgi:membrane associated rhomboid family serine protease
MPAEPTDVVSDRRPLRAAESAWRDRFETLAGLPVPWSYLPLTIGAFVALTWLLLELEVSMVDLGALPPAIDPFSLLSGLVLHSDAQHFQNNMRLLVPFGIVLTLLTNNRHVLGIILVSHLLSAMLYGVVSGPVIGSSGAVFGLTAATLVRSIGEGLQNASVETLQTVIYGMLAPFLTVLLVVAIFNIPPGIAHFGHFFGFLFGAAYEAIVVFRQHETEGQEQQVTRTAPHR